VLHCVCVQVDGPPGSDGELVHAELGWDMTHMSAVGAELVQATERRRERKQRARSRARERARLSPREGVVDTSVEDL